MILDGKLKESLRLAVECLKRGDIVGFPTETVYGLGGDALSPLALEKIFEVKSRPKVDPLILHIASHEQLSLITEGITENAKKLIQQFWPGPLTIIFNKKPVVPDLATAGLSTVAVRMPRHLIALALIKNSNCIIAAPSANKFQSISPTTALSVEKELGSSVPFILDGGPCQVGLESTVLSLIDEPTILRPGAISLQDIEGVLGTSVRQGGQNRVLHLADLSPKASPGLFKFHYAPKTPLKLFNSLELAEFIAKKRSRNQMTESILICFSSDERKKFDKKGFKKLVVLSNCGNLDEAGRNLFSALRQADEENFKYIFALECPREKIGLALNDRLKKAEHGF
jgi:L-threonylcarbamoyladenylate synthase